MALDRSVVEKAAGLARIALTPEEVERFTGQLSVVLKAVERLKEVDTEKVSPTASVLPVSNVMREDEIRPGLSRDEALANAPKGGRDGEFFREARADGRLPFFEHFPNRFQIIFARYAGLLPLHTSLCLLRICAGDWRAV